jgi:hypothetical protein
MVVTQNGPSQIHAQKPAEVASVLEQEHV